MADFVDVGHSNYVTVDKIISVSKPDSAPTKRMIQTAKENNLYLDLTSGKRTRSIIYLNGRKGIVIAASSILTSTIIERIKKNRATYYKSIEERISI